MSHRVYAVDHLNTFDSHDQYGYYKEMPDDEFNWRLQQGQLNTLEGRYYYGKLPQYQSAKSHGKTVAIHATRKSQLSVFRDTDQFGYFRTVTGEDFDRLNAAGHIVERNGVYYYIEDASDTDIIDGKATPGYNPDAPAGAPVTDSQFGDDPGRLYSDPGRTLKSIADIMCVIFSLISIVAGVGAGVLFGEASDSEFSTFAFILVSAVGIIIAYVSNLALAAFGDLVMNANEINRKLK